MPLLVIAVLTHVIYRWIARSLGWTGDATQRAWDASLAHSRSVADRLLQALSARVAAWEETPGLASYLGWAARWGGRGARGIGRLGFWGLGLGLKGTFAVTRGLLGGLFSRTGLLAALIEGTREGLALGAAWWQRRNPDAEGLARRWAEWMLRWGHPREPETETEPGPETETEPIKVEYSWGQAVPNDPTPTQPLNNPVVQGRSPEATEVRSIPEGQATPGGGAAVIDPPAPHNPQGEPSTMTDLVPATTSGDVAPLSPADGLKYDQATTYLEMAAQRARELAGFVNEIHELRKKALAAIKVMGGDHLTAQEALAQFNVTVPNMAAMIELLELIGTPAAEDDLANVLIALGMFSVGCEEDRLDLITRIGPAREVVIQTGINPEFVAN